MTTLFEELFKPDNRVYPKQCNWINSTDDIYIAELELAGFAKKDVSIKADNDTLSIKAKKEEKEKNFSISLNDLVLPEDITSKMSNGLLTITMPKKKTKQSLSIKIN